MYVVLCSRVSSTQLASTADLCLVVHEPCDLLESPRTEELLWTLPRQMTAAQSRELICRTCGSSCRRGGRWRCLLCRQSRMASREGGRALAKLQLPCCSTAALPPHELWNKPCLYVLPFLPQPGFTDLDCAPIKLIYWCVFMKNWNKLLSHSCIYRRRVDFSHNSINYWLLWASFLSRILQLSVNAKSEMSLLCGIADRCGWGGTLRVQCDSELTVWPAGALLGIVVV